MSSPIFYSGTDKGFAGMAGVIFRACEDMLFVGALAAARRAYRALSVTNGTSRFLPAD